MEDHGGKKYKEGVDKENKRIYKDIVMKIRPKEGLTRGFKINKGVRQGCVMSPSLFNLYITDIDKELGMRGVGGIMVGKKRVWSLAYADDMVLVAKNRDALLDMMRTLKRFLKERKVEVCPEKKGHGL